MYICKYYYPICMNDAWMICIWLGHQKIVIVLSVLPNWNKIVNQSKCMCGQVTSIGVIFITDSLNSAKSKQRIFHNFVCRRAELLAIPDHENALLILLTSWEPYLIQITWWMVLPTAYIFLVLLKLWLAAYTTGCSLSIFTTWYFPGLVFPCTNSMPWNISCFTVIFYHCSTMGNWPNFIFNIFTMYYVNGWYFHIYYKASITHRWQSLCLMDLTTVKYINAFIQLLSKWTLKYSCFPKWALQCISTFM